MAEIPMPTAEQLFPAGGQLIRSGNALNDFRMKQLQNQYYGPNIESEMANRNALTQGQNITNQYMPEKMKLANAYQNMVNQWYGPNQQANINSLNASTNKTNTMTPLEAQQMSIQNEFGRQREQADIANKNAMVK